MHSSHSTANDIYGRIIKRSLASLPCSLKWHLVVGQTFGGEERIMWPAAGLESVKSLCWSGAVGPRLHTTVSCYVTWFDLMWCARRRIVVGTCYGYVFMCVCVCQDISIPRSPKVAYGSLVAQAIFFPNKKKKHCVICQWVPCSKEDK